MAISPLFDAYVVVDWSAAAAPVRGTDSIWYTVYLRGRRGLRRTALANPTTRAAATAALATVLATLAQQGARILAGFDFPFGYPAGTADRLGLPGLPWRHMWQELADLLEDLPDNANNRFAVAEALNERLSGEPFPFWGTARDRPRRFLRSGGRRPHGPADVAERRHCEVRTPRAQSVWKLAYTGSVGSQALTGIPRVLQLRTDPRLAGVTHIWPFETGLRHDPAPQIVLAEVYPSLVPALSLPGRPRDAGQVTAMARHLARADEAGTLASWFRGDPALSCTVRHAVETEEGWILGVADRPLN